MYYICLLLCSNLCKSHDQLPIISLQKAHKGVVGLVIVIILTLVTAALCVIGILMYGRRAKRSA